MHILYYAVILHPYNMFVNNILMFIVNFYSTNIIKLFYALRKVNLEIPAFLPQKQGILRFMDNPSQILYWYHYSVWQKGTTFILTEIT